MDNNTRSRQRLVDFRLQIYASFALRADARLELVDALLLSPILCSAVEVSQSSLFRRGFASNYDARSEGQIDPAVLRQTLVAAEPPDARTVAGIFARVGHTGRGATPRRKGARSGPGRAAQAARAPSGGPSAPEAGMDRSLRLSIQPEAHFPTATAANLWRLDTSNSRPARRWTCS